MFENYQKPSPANADVDAPWSENGKSTTHRIRKMLTMHCDSNSKYPYVCKTKTATLSGQKTTKTTDITATSVRCHAKFTYWNIFFWYLNCFQMASIAIIHRLFDTILFPEFQDQLVVEWKKGTLCQENSRRENSMTCTWPRQNARTVMSSPSLVKKKNPHPLRLPLPPLLFGQPLLRLARHVPREAAITIVRLCNLL